MREKINQLLLAVLVVGITALSFVNPPQAASSSSGILSPVMHFTAYFLLAGALMLYFHDTTKGHVESFLIAAIFGLLMEIGQLHIPWRTFGWSDVLVNALGASVVFLDHRVGLVTWIVETEDRLIEEYLAS